MTDDEQRQLGKDMAGVLHTLLSRGFKFPIMFASLSVNAQVHVGRYEQDESGAVSTEILAEKVDDPEGFLMPLNIMYVDRIGEAARVVIGEVGGDPEVLN